MNKERRGKINFPNNKYENSAELLVRQAIYRYDFTYETEDIEKLACADHSFDVILSHYMLYNTNSPVGALLLIHRVLKENGFFGIFCLIIIMLNYFLINIYLL